MNAQHIEDIITVLYDTIQDARSLPLGADKCILERDKVLDLLDEIIAQLPTELKEARSIVESRNELIAQARRESESIIRQAHEQAAMLVSKEAVVEEAKRQAQDILLQNQQRMAEIRRAGNSYMDNALQQTEAAVAKSLEDIRNTRMQFLALSEAQEQRPSSHPAASVQNIVPAE